MATKEKIVAVVAMLCEAFNRKPTPATYKAYEIALSDIDDEFVTSAGNVVLTSSREFMPNPGQLRELAVTGGIGYEQRAERAWLEFDRAVIGEGADHSVSFADGLINATVRLLGDWGFCATRSGDEYAVWLRKQFLETSTGTYAHRQYRNIYDSRLIGSMYRQNAMNFSAEELQQLARSGANIGLPVNVTTSQPILLPAVDGPARIENRADIPRIEFKTVG
jgi:hypothetical protein